MAARHEEGCYGKKHILKHVLVCEGLSNDDVRVARGIVFQEIFKEGGGFKTGDFVKEKGRTTHSYSTKYGCQGRQIPGHTGSSMVVRALRLSSPSQVVSGQCRTVQNTQDVTEVHSYYVLGWIPHLQEGVFYCTYCAEGRSQWTQIITIPHKIPRGFFQMFEIVKCRIFQNKTTFFRQESCLNFYGKVHNFSKTGFPTNVTNREKCLVFGHDSWHFLCSLGRTVLITAV